MPFTLSTDQPLAFVRTQFVEDYTSLGYPGYIVTGVAFEDDDAVPWAFNGTTLYCDADVNDSNSGSYVNLDAIAAVNTQTGVATVSVEDRAGWGIHEFHAIRVDDSRLYGWRYQYTPSNVWYIESYDPTTLDVTGSYTIPSIDFSAGVYGDPIYPLDDYVVAGTAWGGHILNAAPSGGVLTRTTRYTRATVPGYDDFYDATAGAPDYENNKVYFACWFDSDAIQVKIMCLDAALGTWSDVTPWVSNTGFDPYEAGDYMDLIFDPGTGLLILAHMHAYEAAITWPEYASSGYDNRHRLIGIDPVAQTVEWTNVIIPSFYDPPTIPRGPYQRLMGDGKMYIQFAYYYVDSGVPQIAEIDTATGTLNQTILPWTLWPDEGELYDWYYPTLLMPNKYGFAWADRISVTPAVPGAPGYRYAVAYHQVELGDGTPPPSTDVDVARRQPQICLIGM